MCFAQMIFIHGQILLKSGFGDPEYTCSLIFLLLYLLSNGMYRRYLALLCSTLFFCFFCIFRVIES